MKPIGQRRAGRAAAPRRGTGAGAVASVAMLTPSPWSGLPSMPSGLNTISRIRMVKTTVCDHC